VEQRAAKFQVPLPSGPEPFATLGVERGTPGVLMSRAELYRTYAAECLQIAQVVSDHDHRSRLVEMARRWHELADKAERTPEED
jgi:hypothetical protein